MTIITTTLPAPTTPLSIRRCHAIRMDQDAQRPFNDQHTFLTVVFTIGIGVIVASTEAGRWTHASAATRLTFDPTNLSLTGVLFGQLMIGILGVLVVSAEYGTGTIRASLAAVPNRRLFLAAKAATFAVVASGDGSVRHLRGLLRRTDADHRWSSSRDPHRSRCVACRARQRPLPGRVGLAGRRAGLDHPSHRRLVAAFVGILLVFPLWSPAFPTSIQNAISKFEPTSIGDAMSVVNTHFPAGSAPSFSPWVGLAILVAYAAVALGPAPGPATA